MPGRGKGCLTMELNWIVTYAGWHSTHDLSILALIPSVCCESCVPDLLRPVRIIVRPLPCGIASAGPVLYWQALASGQGKTQTLHQPARSAPPQPIYPVAMSAAENEQGRKPGLSRAKRGSIPLAASDAACSLQQGSPPCAEGPASRACSVGRRPGCSPMRPATAA